MPQKPILIDSNSYFRLARYIHPFLNKPIFSNTYRLYIVKELEDEYRKSKRLMVKFDWVYEEQFVENRKVGIITIPKKKKEDIKIAYDIIHSVKKEKNFSTQYYDIHSLAIAHVFEIGIVTDDKDMLHLANIFKIKKYNTIQLLKKLHLNRDIGIEDVKNIICRWKKENDLPSNCKKDYEKYFNDNFDELE